MSNVIVLGLSGPSCSGKTSLSLNLIKLFPCTIVIHQDDFYKDDSQVPYNQHNGLQDWDCPGSFDMNKMVTDIINTREKLESVAEINSSIQYLRDHFASQWANPPNDVDKLISEDDLAEARQQILQGLGIDTMDKVPFALIIVDGFLLYYDDHKDVKGEADQGELHPASVCDMGLFIYADYETLKARREARLGYATKDGIWNDPPGYFDSIVWPNFIKYHSGLATAHPEISHAISDRKDPSNQSTSKDSAISSHQYANVAVCSSDAPGKVALYTCIKHILKEWSSRKAN